MAERIDQEHRDQLVEVFASTAHLLTTEEALTIVKIMEEACRRESASIEEEILKAMIEGPTEGAPTPGAEE